jgi:hypothetical protein
MTAVLQQSHIVTLPSMHEVLTALAERAACGAAGRYGYPRLLRHRYDGPRWS